MESREQLGDTGPEYAFPKSHAGPSGIRLMEIRRNSEPDTTCPHYLFIVSRLAICPCLYRAGKGSYIKDDDMLGRAAVPRVQQLQFATSFIRKEKLAATQAYSQLFQRGGNLLYR